VLLKIVYLLIRWLFGLTVLVFRGDQARDAELLVLRLENAALSLIAYLLQRQKSGRGVWSQCR
jgi:hypothetical protein